MSAQPVTVVVVSPSGVPLVDAFFPTGPRLRAPDGTVYVIGGGASREATYADPADGETLVANRSFTSIEAAHAWIVADAARRARVA